MYWPWKTLIKAKFIKEKTFYSIQYKFKHGIAFNDPKQNQNGQFNKLNTTMMPYHIVIFKEIWNQNKSWTTTKNSSVNKIHLSPPRHPCYMIQLT